jgi:hypothetical protein
MSVYVELTNNELKIVEVSKKNTEVLNYEKLLIPSFNGEAEEISETLKGLNKNYKKLIFIDNSNHVIYYDMKVPNLNRDKILTICKNELITKLNKNEDLLIEYFDIKKESDSENKILATALSTRRVKSLIDAGKQLKAGKIQIRLAYEGIFNYLTKGEIFNEKGAIVVVEIKENVIRSWLFESNEFVNLRVNRIRSDEYIELIELVNDDISKLIQFQSTRRRSFKISDVYLFGDYKNIDLAQTDLDDEFTNIKINKLPLVGNVILPEDFDYLANIYSMGFILGDK